MMSLCAAEMAVKIGSNCRNGSSERYSLTSSSS